MSDDYGDDREELDEPVVVVPAAAEWLEQAAAIIGQFRSLLPAASDVQHIGSTAVPGLAAKPVIDIAVAIAPAFNDQAVEQLRPCGFTDLGESGVSGRRYLRRRGVPPAINVHLMEPGGRLWLDNLLLRDYLRSHPQAQAAYAAAKQQAAARNPTLLAYSAAKSNIVRALLTAARAQRQSGS